MEGALDDVFARLGDADPADRNGGIYTTLAPLYRVMYAARGRIEGQLATVRESAPTDAGTVVELGCGTGDLLIALDGRYDRVVGADPSPRMCWFAADRGGQVCRADARAFAPGSADLVVLLGAVLGHVRPDAAARWTLDRVAETLRPGGRAVLSVHNRRRLDRVRERELSRSVEGYRITQRDRQRPTADGEFEWEVTFEMTDRTTGDCRMATTVTTLRAFDPGELRAWFADAGLRVVDSRPRTGVDGDGEDGRVFVAVGERPAG